MEKQIKEMLAITKGEWQKRKKRERQKRKIGGLPPMAQQTPQPVLPYVNMLQ